MKLLIGFLLVMLNVQASSDIFNGRLTKEGEHENVALLFFGAGKTCTGSIISHNTVLTAAHCLVKPSASHSFLNQTIDVLPFGGISNEEPIVLSEKFPIHANVHPNYIQAYQSKDEMSEDMKYFIDDRYDIGVLVYENGTFSNIKPITISKNEIDYSKDFFAVGFGKYGTGNTTFSDFLDGLSGKEPFDLQKREGTIMLDKKSSEAQPFFLVSENTNVGSPTRYAQILEGDSGGPLLDTNGSQVGIGTQSFRPPGEPTKEKITYKGKEFEVNHVGESGLRSAFIPLAAPQIQEYLKFLQEETPAEITFAD